MAIEAKAIAGVGDNKVELIDISREDLAANEILVELECSAVSAGTELYSISRATAENPAITGYAPIGRITEIGADVSGFEIGERVTYFSPTAGGGGHQSPARILADPSHLEKWGNNFCLKIPESVSSEAAAYAGISSISMLGCDLASPQEGDKVLIIGQGIIGLYATRHFSLAGAEVIAVDLQNSRLEKAKSFGASHTINPGDGDMVEAVKEIWPGRADIIVDVTGSYKVVEDSIPAIRQKGKYVFLAWYKGAGFNLECLHGRVFEAYFPWTLQTDLVRRSLELMRDGKIDSQSLISHRFKPADANEAYDLLRSGDDSCSSVIFDWR